MQFPVGEPEHEHTRGEARRSVAKSKYANLEARAMLRIVFTCLAAGVHISIENPEHSLLWYLPEIQELISHKVVNKYAFDLCCHGMKSPAYVRPVEYYKKPTALVSTLHGLQVLCKRCRRSHVHTGLGRRSRFKDASGKWISRISWAARYPTPFCQELLKVWWGNAGCPSTLHWC